MNNRRIDNTQIHMLSMLYNSRPHFTNLHPTSVEDAHSTNPDPNHLYLPARTPSLWKISQADFFCSGIVEPHKIFCPINLLLKRLTSRTLFSSPTLLLSSSEQHRQTQGMSTFISTITPPYSTTKREKPLLHDYTNLRINLSIH